MRAIGRVLRYLAIGIVALVVVAIALGSYLVSRSLPDYGAELRVAGIGDEIEILRDYRAAPHVFARTDADVYFGLGFVHAQDRLWQMELRRRAAQGRLSELFGVWGGWLGLSETLLRADVTMRAIDLQGAARRSLESFSPEARSALDAYAAGVNAWLAVVDDQALGAGAPELLALGAGVAPWRPEDSIAAFKLLSARLAGSMFSELRRARFAIAVGAERVQDLFPDDASRGVTALTPYAALFGEDAQFADAGPEPAVPDWLAQAAPFPFGADPERFGGASNAWAVSGDRSSTRTPLLASDPHLELTAPGIWYAARLEFADGGVIGGTVPGVPAVLVGRNTQVAWGLTTLPADVADIYIERVNPDDENQYKTPDGWAEFESRLVTIPLAGGEAVEARLRSTRHGPVLPLDWPAVAAVTPGGHVASLSWTVLSEQDRSLEAALRLMRAGSVADATPLADLVTAPVQNVIIADREHIGLFSVGRVPRRHAEHTTRGRTPAPGWIDENDWRGWLRLDEMPRAIDPASGVVANANNRTTDAPFPLHLSYDWAAPYRMQRLAKVLNNREYHTLRGFLAIQNDTVSPMARAVLPLIAAQLWKAQDDEAGLRRDALNRLAQWNGDMDPFLAEPLIFSAWSRALTRRLTEDELGGLSEHYSGARPLFLERVYRDIDGAAGRWCDDGRTPDLEDCALMASLALDDALAELTEGHGASIAGWRWGKAHEAFHRHQPFGDAPVLGEILNIRHETGGGDHTLLRGRFTGEGPAPYQNVHAGGYRAVYDFADLDRSLYAIATGESGHFLSRHYDDFVETWRAGEYASLSLERKDAEAGAVGVTRLLPAEPAPLAQSE